MTTYYVNNGDGLTTMYWAIPPWQRATSYPTGSIIRQPGGIQTMAFALDMTHGYIWVKDLAINGYWNDSSTADPGSNVGGFAHAITGGLYPAVSEQNFCVITANFGASAFIGTLPTGFSSINTANGSAVTFDPANCSSNVTLSNGNLTMTGNVTGNSGNNFYSVRATQSFTTGLLYWEVTLSWQTGMQTLGRNQNNAVDWTPGICNATPTLTGSSAYYIGQDANGICYWCGGGALRRNNSNVLTLHNMQPPTAGNERCYRNNGSTFTSGNTVPSFPTGPGNTVTDGTGTWTEITGQATYGWNAPFARIYGVANSGRPTNGDVFYVGDNHTELGYSLNTVQMGSNTNNWFFNIISVDHTVASPTSANLLAGAQIGYTQSYGATHFDGSFTLNGFTIQNLGPSAGSLSTNNNRYTRFINCTFQNNSNANGSCFCIGNTGGSNTAITMYDSCTFTNNQSTTGMLRSGGARAWFRNCTFTSSTSPSLFYSVFTSVSSDIIFEGCDFTGITASNPVVHDGGLPCCATLLFTRCKLPRAVYLQVTNGNNAGYPEVTWYECDAGSDQQAHGRADCMGAQVDNKIVTRTGGATDSLSNFSEQFTTTANPSFSGPLRSLPMETWNSVIGVTRTVTIRGIANVSAMPLNSDIWLRARYLSSASSLLGSEGTTMPANVLITGTSYSADTSAWDANVTARGNSTAYVVGNVIKLASNPGRVFFCTTNGNSASSEPSGYATAVDGGSVTDGTAIFRAGWRFTMAVALSSPQLAGLISAQIEIAKASSTYFIDPQFTLS